MASFVSCGEYSVASALQDSVCREDLFALHVALAASLNARVPVVNICICIASLHAIAFSQRIFFHVLLRDLLVRNVCLCNTCSCDVDFAT